MLQKKPLIPYLANFQNPETFTHKIGAEGVIFGLHSWPHCPLDHMISLFPKLYYYRGEQHLGILTFSVPNADTLFQNVSI